MNFLKRVHRFLLPDSQDVGLSPYVLLLFLSFLLFNYLLATPDVYHSWVLVFSLAVFLVCFFRIYWVGETQKVFYILSISMIGLAVSSFNAGGMVFFIYAAGFCCSLRSGRRSFQMLAIVVSLFTVFCWLTEKPFYFFVPGVLLIITIGIMNIQNQSISKKNKALKQSQQEIKLLAQTAERERISRDLHDLLGHTLSVITLKAELARKMINKGGLIDQAKTEVEEIESLSRESLQQVRQAIKGYNNTTVEAELLQAQVAAEAAQIELTVDEPLAEVPENISVQLGMIVREAFTNVIRHSNSPRASFSLRIQNDWIEMKIANGGSFSESADGSGMKNMKQRIESLRGKFELIKEPDTTLIFRCPVV